MCPEPVLVFDPFSSGGVTPDRRAVALVSLCVDVAMVDDVEVGPLVHPQKRVLDIGQQLRILQAAPIRRGNVDVG